MDLYKLCLKVPNVGILLYYLIFIVIIPYILIYSQNTALLKYYMTMMVAFAHLLTYVGDENYFGNLYQLNPTEFVPFLSSNFINIFTLFGILWQCIEFSRKYNLTHSVIYGIVLFMIALPFARAGLKFVLDNIDIYMKEKADIDFKYNWHLVVFGILYIIFILGLQAILLTLVGFGAELPYNKINNNGPKNNLYKNNENDTVNKTKNFLQKFNLSNLGNFNTKLNTRKK